MAMPMPIPARIMRCTSSTLHEAARTHCPNEAKARTAVTGPICRHAVIGIHVCGRHQDRLGPGQGQGAGDFRDLMS